MGMAAGHDTDNNRKIALINGPGSPVANKQWTITAVIVGASSNRCDK
jgi:hypothetical protein